MKNIFLRLSALLTFSTTYSFPDQLSTMIVDTKNNAEIVKELKNNADFSDYYRQYKTPLSVTVAINHPSYVSTIYKYKNDLDTPFGGYTNSLNYLVNNIKEESVLERVIEAAFNNEKMDINKKEFDEKSLLFYLIDKNYKELLKKAITFKGTELDTTYAGNNLLEYDTKKKAEHVEILLDHFKQDRNKIIRNVIENKKIGEKRREELVGLLIKDTIMSGVRINPAELLGDLNKGINNRDVKNLALVWFSDKLTVPELIAIKDETVLKDILRWKRTPTNQELEKIIADLKLYHPELDFKPEDNLHYQKESDQTRRFIKKKLSFQDKLKLSSSVDLRNEKGETPFILSTKADFLETSEYILEQLPDLGVKDKACQRNALHYAVLNENERLVSKIIELNIDLEQRDCIGFTALEIAIAKNNPAIIKDIVKHTTFEKGGHSINGYPLLAYSIKNKMRTLSKILLNYTDADVDEEDPVFGHNALVYSVMQEDKDITALVLKKTKKLSFTNINNNTLLDYVVTYENDALLDMLLDNGADFNKPLSNGLEPIFVLIKNKSPILPRILSTGKINLDIEDSLYQEKPLWWAAMHNNLEAFEAIVSKNRLYFKKEEKDSVLRKVLSDLKLFKLVVEKRLYDKEVIVDEKKLTNHIIDSYPYLFKHLLKLETFTEKDRREIFRHALDTDNQPIAELILEKGFMDDRIFVKSVLMDMGEKEIKWILETRYGLFFYMNNKGEVPFIEYLKNYKEDRILHIIRNTKKVDIEVKDGNGDTPLKHLAKVRNIEILKYFFVKMNFKQKEEMLEHKYSEELMIGLVNKIEYKSDIRLFFSYAIKHGYSNLTRVILGKNVIQDKDIMESVKQHYNSDLIRYILSSKLLDTKNKVKDFIFDIKDHRSFKFAIDESGILLSSTPEEKIEFLNRLVEEGIFYDNMELLLEEGRLLDIKDHIFAMIVDNATDRSEWLRRFFKKVGKYSEPETSNTFAKVIISKDAQSLGILVDNGFDVNKEDKKGNKPLGLMFKYLPDESLIALIMNKTPLDSYVGNYRLIDLIIQKRYFRLFESFLKNEKYRHLLDATAIRGILETQDIRFFEIMNKNNYDFGKNEIIYEAIKLSDTETLEKIISERMKSEIQNLEAKPKNKIVKINPLEYFLMFREGKNQEQAILKKLLSKYSIEGDVGVKFNSILHKGLGMKTLKTIMEKIEDKTGFITKNELLRMGLKNDISYNVFLYLKSNVNLSDEEFVYQRKPLTGIDLPTAITLSSDSAIHEYLKKFNIEKLDSGIFRGLIDNNNPQITEWLIKQGIDPDSGIIAMAGEKNNLAGDVILRADEIDPVWNDGLRHVKKNKVGYIIFVILLLLAAMGYKQLRKYLEDKRFEMEAARIMRYKIDQSWGVEQICKEIQRIKKEVRSEEPVQEDFDNFNYYKYYLELLKRKEHAEKSEWVKEENVQELLEELHHSENMILSDEELTRLLGEIGDGSTAEGATLMDDNSELDLEELEHNTFNRKDIDEKTLNKIIEMGENPEELDDETLHMLVDSIQSSEEEKPNKEE